MIHSLETGEKTNLPEDVAVPCLTRRGVTKRRGGPLGFGTNVSPWTSTGNAGERAAPAEAP